MPADYKGFKPEEKGYKFEPLRQMRWELNIGGGNDAFKDLKLILLSCSRPSVSHSPVEVHHFNDRFYLAGKPEYQSIEFTMYDAQPSEGGPWASELIEQWGNLVFNPTTNAMLPAEGGGTTGYKRDCVLTMMDGEGNDSLSWKLYGCFPETINYNATGLDYSASESLTVTVTMRIDKAIIDNQA